MKHFKMMFSMAIVVLALAACGGNNNESQQRPVDDDVMMGDMPSQSQQTNDGGGAVAEQASPQRATISGGTHKYRRVKEVSPDGEVQAGDNKVFYLTFDDGGESFYISNVDGSRSNENGGYGTRYVPGGTGFANNFANPTTFRQQSSSGGYLTYESRRAIANNSNPDDIAGYATDYAKTTADRTRINLKIGDDSGYSAYYGSIQPLMCFNKQGWTEVLELVEDGPSADFY